MAAITTAEISIPACMTTCADDLVNQQWRGASQDALVRAHGDPFADESRAEITGPSVFGCARASLHLSPTLHELATNSCKHRAVSDPGGTSG